MFVSGPIAMIDTSPGLPLTSLRMISVAGSSTGLIVGVGKSSPPKPFAPCHQPPLERSRCAGGDPNVRAAGDLNHAQSILQSQFDPNVAGHNRDRLNLQFGRAHREQERQRVIHPRISVDDDLARRCHTSCGETKE